MKTEIDYLKAALNAARRYFADPTAVNVVEWGLANRALDSFKASDQPETVTISRVLLAHTIDKVDDLARGYEPSRKEMAEAREIEIKLSELLDEHDTKLKSALNSK